MKNLLRHICLALVLAILLCLAACGETPPSVTPAHRARSTQRRASACLLFFISFLDLKMPFDAKSVH